MWRSPFFVIIFLSVLGAGAATWWLGSANDRRVSACREAGIENADRLARCAESAEASQAALEEKSVEWMAEFHERARNALHTHLADLRAGARSEVDKSRFESLSVERLIESYDLPPFLINHSDIPVRIEDRRFAVEGSLSGPDVARDESEPNSFAEWALPEFDLSPLSYDVMQTGLDNGLIFRLAADIEDLNRNERAFAWRVCGSLYASLAYGPGHCPVIAYGRVVFKAHSNFFDRNIPGFLEPVFRIEAVEFLDPPQP